MYGEYVTNCKAVQETTEPVSVVVTPTNHRCRYWAKLIRCDEELPYPGTITDANSIPGPYLKRSADIEMSHGDFLFEGEALHHRKQRGWDFLITVCNEDDTVVIYPSMQIKQFIKNCPDIPKDERKRLLEGSGDHAAMIRIAKTIQYLGVAKGLAVIKPEVK
jgi:hypothetical protein